MTRWSTAGRSLSRFDGRRTGIKTRLADDVRDLLLPRDRHDVHAVNAFHLFQMLDRVLTGLVVDDFVMSGAEENEIGVLVALFRCKW